MKKDFLELMVRPVKNTKDLHVADHTYVVSPGKPALPCYGGATGGHPRLNEPGYYDVASCCWSHHTSYSYGVNGVCHQAANRCLFSTGKTISNAIIPVDGYFGSLALYGVYGIVYRFSSWRTALESDIDLEIDFFAKWMKTVYGPCYSQYVGDSSPEKLDMDSPDPVFNQIREYYLGLGKSDGKESEEQANEHVASELGIVLKHNGIPADSLRAPHLELLAKKDKIISSGASGKELADQINSISKEFQAAAEKELGAEAFEKLTGQKPGEYYAPVDPEIAAKEAERESGSAS